MKSAVKKYSDMYAQGLSIQELTDAIEQDEKGYSPEECKQIFDAVEQAVIEAKKGTGNKPQTLPAAKKEKASSTNVSPHYEEWRMERVLGENGKPKMQKLKKIRDCVKITEEEAGTLNMGAESNGSVNPIMYFLPE
jgi:hypothetical protein